jgi:radical SAM superfamily enzyme YgiQ (UPF0313 family)
MESEKYDVIAVSAVEYNFKQVYEVTPKIKDLDPYTLIAVGGFVAAEIGAKLINHPAIDAIFEDEGEYSFSLFLKHLKKQKKHK